MLLMAAALAHVLLCLAYPLSWADNALQIVGAWSLARGQGYRDISRPDAPAVTHYPPGYPAFLSLLLGWLGSSFLLYRLPSVPLYVLSLPIIDALLSGRLGPAARLLVTALYAVHPIVIWAVYLPCQASLHSLVFLLSVWLIEARLSVGPPSARSVAAIVGLLVANSYLHLRALALVLATVVFLATRSGWRRATVAVALLTGVLVAPWFAWTQVHGGGWLNPVYEGFFVADVRDHRPGAPFAVALLSRALANVASTPFLVGETFVGPFATRHAAAFVEAQGLSRLADGITTALGLIAVVGFAAALWRGPTFVEVVVLSHLLMHWLVWIAAMYLVFLAPFIWYYLFLGARVLCTAIAGPAPRPRLAWGVGITLLLLVLARDRPYWAHIGSPLVDTSARSYTWLADHVPADGVVACVDVTPHTQVFYLYSGRRAVPLYGLGDAETIVQRVTSDGAGHVLVDPRRAPAGLEAAAGARWRRVAVDATTGWALYRVEEVRR